MQDWFLEVLRVFALIVLVWFGLVGWKLVPLGGAWKPRADGQNLGDH